MKATKTYNLLIEAPQLADFWDYEQNEKKAEEYTPGSNAVVYWKCNKGHSFKSAIKTKYNSKANVFYCHVCKNKVDYRKATKTKNLSITHPQIANEWHPTKNNIGPDEVTYGVGKKYWWLCEDGHEWLASPNQRTNSKSGCPDCSKQSFNASRPGRNKFEFSLAKASPELVKQWHPTKNKFGPHQVARTSRKEAWWLCENNHEWMKPPAERLRGERIQECPKCPKKNNLLKDCPEIVELWDYEKNSKGPEYFSPVGAEEAYFKCKQEHSYKRRIDGIRRSLSTGNTGCPECSRKTINVQNSIVSTHPYLLREWDYENNEKTPEEVAPGTRYFAYWICTIGHHYQMEVYRRTGKELRGCPHCSYSPRSQEEIILMFELMNFFEIDPDNHIIKVGNKKYNVDIIIPKEKIVIEYDGSYWHKDKASQDIKKTGALQNNGWTVIRAREKGGKKPLRILSKKYNVFVYPRKFKDTANNVLLKIQSIGFEIKDLDKYINKKNLTNKKKALNFLDELVLRQKKFKV